MSILSERPIPLPRRSSIGWELVGSPTEGRTTVEKRLWAIGSPPRINYFRCGIACIFEGVPRCVVGSLTKYLRDRFRRVEKLLARRCS